MSGVVDNASSHAVNEVDVHESYIHVYGMEILNLYSHIRPFRTHFYLHKL